MKKYLIAKCEELLKGKEVIMSDTELDILTAYNISDYIASRFNPNPIGTKDRYVVFIKPVSLKKANEDNPFHTVGESEN